MVTKVNPVYVVTDSHSYIGKTIMAFDVDFNVDISASTGPNGAIAKVFSTLADRTTIVMHSAITGVGQLITVYVEGDFGTDTWDGVNAETFAVHLEDTIQALGVVDTINLAGATVVAGDVFSAV